MAIDGPEAIDGAPPLRGLDSTGGTFLAREEWRLCRQGKKVATTLLRQSGRGEDVLRADQPITRGRLDAGWDRRGEEIKATLKARQERQDRHHRRVEPPPLASGQYACHH